MFPNIKPPFSTPATTFGFSSTVNQNPFGQTAFGKSPSTGFGTPAPAFGSQATPLFGQAAQHASSIFSASTSTPTFGQNVNTQPTFGSSMFGGTVSQPSSSGLFGSSANSTFGQQVKTTGFGGFGTQTANTGFFGQTTNTVQPQQQTGLFGQPTNIFGSQSTGFGSSANAVNNQIGTVIKFVPVTGSDTMVKGSINQTISTRHHCITCMKEYENKSLEELRWEDYQMNRKGPQQVAQVTAGTNIFGGMSQPIGAPLFGGSTSTTPANTSLFGQQQQQQQQQQQDNKSIFGQTGTTGTFGNSGTGAFGTTSATNTSNLFGNKLGSGFGTGTNATTSSAFPFSSTSTSANIFGGGTAGTNTSTTAPKPFGVTSQPNTLFGQQPTFGSTSSTFGGFGTSTTNQNVGLFGQNKTTPFNMMPTSTTTSTFGTFGQPATQNTQSSIFSNTAKTNTGFGTFGNSGNTSIFGQSSFGQTNQNLFNNTFNKTTTPLFGQTQQTSTALGTNIQTASNNSLFGNNLNKPTTNIFGTGSNVCNSGFGLNTNTSIFNISGAAQPQNVSNQDQNNVNAGQQIISMISTPYGIQNLLNNVTEVGTDLKDCTRPTNPTELNSLLNSVTKSQSKVPADKLKPVQVFGRKVPMFEGLEHRDETLLSNIRINNNPKRLLIRNKPIVSSISIDGSNSIFEDSFSLNNISFPDEECKENMYPNIENVCKELTFSSTTINSTKDNSNINSDSLISTNKSQHNPNAMGDGEKCSDNDGQEITSTYQLQETETEENQDLSQTLHHPLAESTATNVSAEIATLSSMTTPYSSPKQMNVVDNKSAGVILTRPEYYTIPDLSELDKYVAEDGSCIIKGFTIGRVGYGNVYFPEAFDVSNLNLDEIIHFRYKEITVYPDDSKKPPIGQGLNRRAQVTLDKLWPVDTFTKEFITDINTLIKMDYLASFKKICEKQKTRFVEYRPETGSWVFKVDHFSKYGILDSDDDTDEIKGNSKNLNINEKKKIVMSHNNKCSSSKSGFSNENNLTLHNIQMENVLTIERDISEQMQYDNNTNTLDFNNAISQIDDSHLMQNNFDPNSLLMPKCYTKKYTLMKSSFFDDETVLSCHEDDVDLLGSANNETMHVEKVMSNEILANSTVKKMDRLPYNQKSQLNVFSKLTNDTRDSIKPKIVFNHFQPINLIDVSNEDSLKQTYIEEYPDDVEIDNESISNDCDNYLKCVNFNIHLPEEVILSKAKSFKVGWTKGMTFISLSNHNNSNKSKMADQEDNMFTKPRTKTSTYYNQFLDLSKISHSSSSSFPFLEKHLMCQLKSSEKKIIDNVPLYEPCVGSEVLWEHINISNKLPPENLEKQIWSLCATLFAEVPTKTINNFEQKQMKSITIKTESNVRKELFSNWIVNVVESNIKREIEIINNSNSDPFSKILCYLSGNKIAEAAAVARDTQNVRLALFISNLPANKKINGFMKQQLVNWSNVIKYFNETLLKIYLTLTGVAFQVLHHKTIVVYENMEWLRVFAYYFWYVSSISDDLSHSVKIYEKMFKRHEHTAKPLPTYKNVPENTWDLRFELMKLYSIEHYRILNLFNPFTYTNDPLDYRLCWFLLQILQSLGGINMTAKQKNYIHLEFSSQLEQMGLWHYSIFVLMHIPNNEIKKHFVSDILGRYVELDGDTSEVYKKREKQLLNQFKLPIEWLEEQKAILSMSKQKYRDGAYHLCYANKWILAHDVFMEYVFAEHFLSYDYKYLNEIMPIFFKHCKNIPQWEYTGGLIFDFVQLGLQYNELTMVTDINEMYERLYEFMRIVTNVGRRLQSFQSKTFMQDVYLAEMSGRIMNMLRKLMHILNLNSYKTILTTAEISQRLPIAPDFLKLELNSLLTDFLHAYRFQSMKL